VAGARKHLAVEPGPPRPTRAAPLPGRLGKVGTLCTVTRTRAHTRRTGMIAVAGIHLARLPSPQVLADSKPGLVKLCGRNADIALADFDLVALGAGRPALVVVDIAGGPGEVGLALTGACGCDHSISDTSNAVARARARTGLARRRSGTVIQLDIAVVSRP
jgi:hypothetical protein